MKRVIVTEHAVDRFIERCNVTYNRVEAEEFIKRAVENSRFVRKQPDNTFLVCGNRYYFVVRRTGNELVVITCYGDRRMLAWYNRQTRRARIRYAYA